MTRIRKGNRELSVEDGSVDAYIADGWQILDARGNVVRHGTTVSYSGLLIENNELRQTVKRLETVVASLEAEEARKEADIAALVDELEKAKAAQNGVATPSPNASEAKDGTKPARNAKTKE